MYLQNNHDVSVWKTFERQGRCMLWTYVKDNRTVLMHVAMVAVTFQRHSSNTLIQCGWRMRDKARIQCSRMISKKLCQNVRS